MVKEKRGTGKLYLTWKIFMIYFHLMNSYKKLIFSQHNKKEAIMARIARMVSPNEKTVYHIISRTALDGFPFSDIDKDKFLNIIQFFSKIYFTEIMGFCLLDNHFHILVRENRGTGKLYLTLKNFHAIFLFNK